MWLLRIGGLLMKPLAALLVLLCLTLTVSACGGGGGGASSGGSSSSSSVDYSLQAKAAQATANFAVQSNTVTLTWNDNFPAGTTYAVQTQNADGSFSTAESVAGLGGTGAAMTWQRAIQATTIYRIVANVNGGVPLQTLSGATSLAVTIPASLPTIVTQPAEPVSGLVVLSVGGTTTYSGATWYLDQGKMGAGSTSAGNSISWNFSGQAAGAHTVSATLQATPDLTLQVSRPVQVANSRIGMSSTVLTGSIYIGATAPTGVAAVAMSIDGGAAVTLTSFNGCPVPCTTPTGYLFSTKGLASGAHSASVTVTDNAGNTATGAISFTADNAPVIALTSPTNGGFAYQSLVIQGSTTSDKTGTTTTTVTLGNTRIFQTGNATYSTTYDISALKAGTYTLNVQATDPAGKTSTLSETITVASSSATAYTPVFALDANATLLAAGGDLILYAAGDANVHLHNVATGSDVVLNGAKSLVYPTTWTISGNIVVGHGLKGDCLGACVYLWAADGSKTNLSQGVPGYVNGSLDGAPVVKSGYVMWQPQYSTYGSYVLYNISAHTYQFFGTQGASSNFDFYVSGGVVTAVYWTNTTPQTIQKWISSNGTITQLSTIGAASIYPSTDGNRIAWLNQSVNSTTQATTNTLVSEPFGGGAITTYSTNEGSYMLDSQVLAWADQPVYGQPQPQVKVSYAGATTTLPQTLLLGVGNGDLIVGDGNTISIWRSATGQEQTAIDSNPSQTFTGGGMFYFVEGAGSTGTGGNVYRLPLN